MLRIKALLLLLECHMMQKRVESNNKVQKQIQKVKKKLIKKNRKVWHKFVFNPI